MTMSDPGPMPDILKRQPEPKPAVVMEPLHLGTPELVRAINDDYSEILNSERANLPRALAIAEKLNALRARTIRGEWKTKFASFGLKISYETASRYLRIWEHWSQIEELAVEKSVDPTLLTIDAARELWARRNDEEEEDASDANDDSGETDSDGKPTPEAMIAKQAANAEAEAAALNERLNRDVDVDAERRQRVDETFERLMRFYPQDELMELTEMLAKHLGMTLMPIAQSDALLRELGLPTADAAPGIGAARAGVEPLTAESNVELS